MEETDIARPKYAAGTFVENYTVQYQKIWAILGFEWRSLLLNAAVASTIGSSKQREFAAGFTVSDDQKAAIKPILVEMDWYAGVPLEPTRYKYLLMQGMGYKGMIAMITMVIDDLRQHRHLRFQNIYGIAGQRARNDKLDGTVAELYDSLSEQVREHPWVIAQMELMSLTDSDKPFKGAFATEFELFQLALIVASNGQANQLSSTPADDSDVEQLDNIPPREIENSVYTFAEWSSITIVNSPAERRARGEARATSKNNVKHVMQHYGIADNSEVVITASRVGTARVLTTSEAMLHSLNPTIEVVGYAGAPGPDKDDHFTAMLNESANMLMKAVEAELNELLPSGAKPLTSRDVKLALQRLVEDDSMEVVQDILAQIINDQIQRA